MTETLTVVINYFLIKNKSPGLKIEQTFVSDMETNENYMTR